METELTDDEIFQLNGHILNNIGLIVANDTDDTINRIIKGLIPMMILMFDLTSDEDIAEIQFKIAHILGE